MGRPNTTGLKWNEPGYQTAWDALNRDKRKKYYGRYYPKAQRKYQRRRYWLDKYVTARGCDDCGYNQSAVALDWDHRVREDKSFNIGNRVPGASLKKIFNEIRKCDLLCANCHRIKTYEENIERRISRQ